MHSMTGFGRGSAATSDWHATVEVASVNRKQAEVVVQAPRELAELEARIRKQVLTQVSRGRIQVSVHLERAAGALQGIRVDAALARAFHQAFVEISHAVGSTVEPQAADYLRQTGILALGAGSIDPEQAWAAIGPALADALTALASMRAAEGLHLRQDLEQRLSILTGFRDGIAAVAPDRAGRQRDLLLKRLREAGLDLESSDERLIKELALFADRCDVSEELTRIDSHVDKFRSYLAAPESPGRALDFLCQELFREFNTIGSKANDANIAHTVVEAKTELEKIREQVQNVE